MEKFFYSWFCFLKKKLPFNVLGVLGVFWELLNHPSRPADHESTVYMLLNWETLIFPVFVGMLVYLRK